MHGCSAERWKIYEGLRYTDLFFGNILPHSCTFCVASYFQLYFAVCENEKLLKRHCVNHNELNQTCLRLKYIVASHQYPV